MAIRKYLFWKNKDGIRTYKVTKKGAFELMKPSGKEVFGEDNWNDFFSWFLKSAAITEDEYIDFCFLADEEINSPLLNCSNYSSKSKSSWDKKEIEIFCEKYILADTYKIIYSEDKCFTCQNGNVLDADKVKKMYLKCIPKFSIETVEKIDTGSEETSLLNRYFRDRLKELSGN